MIVFLINLKKPSDKFTTISEKTYIDFPVYFETIFTILCFILQMVSEQFSHLVDRFADIEEIFS